MRASRPIAFVLGSLALLLAPAPARAWDVEVSSETIAQAYQLVAGNGSLLDRRRLDQYLGLNVWNIGHKDAFGQPEKKNQFYFTSSLRMEFDFGDFPATALGVANPTTGLGYIDTTQELGTNNFDLLFAYFGGKDVFGFLDFKLGRQIDFSLYEFLSFDGLSVEAKTPWYLAVSAYGGLLVNGYLPIDSPIYRPDGTAPGALTTHDEDPKPVLGVGLRSFGLRDLDASFGYRRVFAPSGDVGCDLPANGAAPDIRTVESCAHVHDGTTEEVLAAQARYRLLDGLLVPWAGFRYNLMVGLVDVIEAGAQINISEKHALRVEYLYSFPTFDGDSIWNVFARQQFDDVRIGYDLKLNRKLRAWARALVRLFHDVDQAVDPLSPAPLVSPGKNVDGGGSLGARLELKHGYLRTDLYGEFGYGGTKVGVDASSRYQVYRDIFGLEGRLTYVHFEDDARPVDNGDSFGFQVGARLSFWKGMLVHAILEDNINRYYSSALRLYALLDVTALMGGYGFAPGAPRGTGPGMGGFGNPYGMGAGY